MIAKSTIDLIGTYAHPFFQTNQNLVDVTITKECEEQAKEQFPNYYSNWRMRDDLTFETPLPRLRCIGCNTFHGADTKCPDGTQWWSGMVVCRVCRHRHVAVIPIKPGSSLPDSECTNCGNMTCEEVSEDDDKAD